MSKSNAELEDAFLRVLQEAEPRTSSRDSLVQEFASHLATLTEVWATESQNLRKHERWLDNWVKKNTPERDEAQDYSTSNEPALAYAGDEDVEGGEATADADVDY